MTGGGGSSGGGDVAVSGDAPLSFYTRAPQRAAELRAFEQLGLLRLRVLRAVTAGSLDGGAIDARELTGEQDTLAHYALRLAFCTSPDLSEWLVESESKLLAARLRTCDASEAVNLLAREGIRYETTADEGGGELVYEVPFQDASALVRQRRVLLRRGVCFVPLQIMRAVAVHHFRVALKQQVKVLRRALAANPETSNSTERLAPILARFVARARECDARSGDANQRDRIQVTAANIDAIAETHFPLCVKHLHRKFRENHHLKYDGRVQYRMFLKGLGWSVQDTLLHFRSEFVRVIPPDRFDKEYAYHIRHSYGLEGARKDYAPPDCAQIIHGAAPRHGQYHGCPFRHWDAAHLNAELRASGLAVSSASQIAALAATGNCQRACQSHFDASHRFSYADAAAALQSSRHHARQAPELPSKWTASVSHPNTWVEASLHGR